MIDVVDRIFFLYRRFLIVLFTLLFAVALAVLWPQETKTLKDAIRRVDEVAVKEQLALWSPALAVRDHPIVYYLSEMAEDCSKEANSVLKLLGQKNWLGRLNDHASPRFHPLTSAYRQRRYNVAKQLVATATQGVLIPEVYASYLDCGDIPRLDVQRVTLVIFLGERRDCVLHYPRKVPFASSRLYADLETRGLLRDKFDAEPQQIPRVRTSGRRVPSSPLPAGAWDSPFFPPPVGVLPRFRDVVMNPSCFVDLVEGMSYYFIGSFANFAVGGIIIKVLIWFAVTCSLAAVMMSLWRDGVSQLLLSGTQP